MSAIVFETPESAEHRARLAAALDRIDDRDPDLAMWLRALNARQDHTLAVTRWLGGLIATITGTGHPAFQTFIAHLLGGLH